MSSFSFEIGIRQATNLVLLFLMIAGTTGSGAEGNQGAASKENDDSFDINQAIQEDRHSESEELLKKAVERLAEKRRMQDEYEESAKRSTQKALEESRNEAVSELIDEMVPIPGKPYMIGKTEVSQKLWEGIMGTNPSRFKYPDHPVECVSWDDVKAFIKTINDCPAVMNRGMVFRLPTPEEWEYSCRAGSSGSFGLLANGQEGTAVEMAWYIPNSSNGGITHPVGTKKPNAWGLYDMHGNVKEWTSELSWDYAIACGGSYASWDYGCTSYARESILRKNRFSTTGFRLCVETVLRSKQDIILRKPDKQEQVRLVEKTSKRINKDQSEHQKESELDQFIQALPESKEKRLLLRREELLADKNKEDE